MRSGGEQGTGARRGCRCAAALALAALSACASSTDGPDASTLGFRAGGGLFDTAEFDDAEDWLGSSINYTVQFTGRKSAQDMNGSAFGLLADVDSGLPDLADRLDLSITVPLAFGDANPRTRGGRDIIAASLADVAAGVHDDAYRRVADRLVESGHDDAILRLGHEFNGSWAPWSSRTNEDEFIAAWRHVHDVMSERSDSFRFDWTAIRPAWFEWGAQAYPGDEYVDIIGIDIYWRVQQNGDPWDNGIWERQFLRVMRDHHGFALSRGKPVSYPEWGLSGADVPQFIERMHEWLGSLPDDGPGALLYHSYFDDTGEFDLDTYPRARDAYRRLFGAD